MELLGQTRFRRLCFRLASQTHASEDDPAVPEESQGTLHREGLEQFHRQWVHARESLPAVCASALSLVEQNR